MRDTRLRSLVGPMHVLTRAALLPTNRPTEPAPPPATVRTASRLWMLAIAAGLGEALVTAYDQATNGSATAREVTALVAVRLVVFVAAYVLVQQTRGGNPWARGSATLLLGIVAMIALVLSPIPSLLSHGMAGVVGNVSVTGLLLASTRVVELCAVATAMVLLFTPRSNAYFRDSR